jgi:hypothetical protein
VYTLSGSSSHRLQPRVQLQAYTDTSRLKAIFGEEEDHLKMRGRILALAFEFTGTLWRCWTRRIIQEHDVVQVSLRLHPPLGDSTSSLTNCPSTYEISTAYFHASYMPFNFPALGERNAPIFDLLLHPGILVDLSGSSARCRKTRTRPILQQPPTATTAPPTCRAFTHQTQAPKIRLKWRPTCKKDVGV